MTQTIEHAQTTTTDEPSEATHIVLVPTALKGQFSTPQAYVLAARIEGFEVTALCGYTWVPDKDPTPLPVCSGCLDIYRNDPKGHGDRGDLPDA